MHNNDSIPRDGSPDFEMLEPEEQLEKAIALPAQACPRRYCWWWLSPLFRWDLLPKEGCTILREKPTNWLYSDKPCCRSDPSSIIDHFVPNQMNLNDDGIGADKWLQARQDNFEKLRAALPGVVQPPG